MYSRWQRGSAVVCEEEPVYEGPVFNPSPGFGTFLFGAFMLGIGILLGPEIVAGTKAGKRQLLKRIERL